STPALIRNSTIAMNAGVGTSGNVTVTNSILAGNNGGNGDCSGTLTTAGGYNLIQNAAGCTLAGTTTGNVIGQDPQLAALADNGGPTKTHAIALGSPALDAGNPGTPGSGGFTCEATDQRGTARPQPSGGRCDIGAFEVVYVPTTTTTSTTTSTSSSSSSSTSSSTTSSTSSSTSSSTATSITSPTTSTG